MGAPEDSVSHRPWSAAELGDLRRALRIGVSIEIIAEFVDRDVDEVRQKGIELGLLPKRKRSAVWAFD
jgi:hypothetical protein